MDVVLGGRRCGQTARIGIALALFVFLVSALSVSASAQTRTVYFTGNGSCFSSSYQPTSIILACADAHTTFSVSEWSEWDDNAARGTGTLSYPNCAATVPLYRCHSYANDAATISLSRPVYCSNVSRWQFTRLLVEDPEGQYPALRSFPESYTCFSFAPLQAVHTPRVTRTLAQHYMRLALHSRFGAAFDHSPEQLVKCTIGISAKRRSCKMGFFEGDVEWFGRGQIWFQPCGSATCWYYSYRIIELNTYCLQVTHKSFARCSRKHVVH